MTTNSEINEIARRIKEEVNSDVDLSIGNIEDPAQAVPILCERMDKICAMMEFQAEMIKSAESNLEEKKYQYKKKELIAKKKYNESFIRFKQEDRQRPRNERRTDPEYTAIAELESNVEMNEALTCEKDYMKSQHMLSDEKHKYEILNNHFLSYRKACDMLVKEMNTFGSNQKARNI
jgi:hypothetical protein